MPSSQWALLYNAAALSGLLFSLPIAAAPLSPQYVFDNFAKRSKRLEVIQLEARSGEAQIGTLEGLYDPEFGLRVGSELSRAESLSGLANLEDRSFSTASSLKKQFSSGTQVELQYLQLRQDSRLNPFTSTLRSPNLVENRFTLLARQSLVYNAFGSGNRRKIEAALKTDEALKLSSIERSEELLLQTLRQFWVAYRAKERLGLALEARRIYESLLKDVREKRRLGLVDSADLSRTSANFERQEQSVKQASAVYLDEIARLYDLMDEELPSASEEIVFSIPSEIPLPPAEALPAKESLRQTQTAQAQLEAIESERAAYKMEDLPLLDLVGEAAWNGVDRTAGRSFSESLSATRPRYYVGVEFGFRFGNKGTRSKLGDLVNRLEISKKELELAQRNVSLQGLSIQRQLASNYRIALSAQSAKGHYRQLLSAQQRSYRVGRIDLSQLILDYTALFDAELMALDAFSNYHQLLHEWAAYNDTLFKRN
jgi:outer membrane protein TolC